MILKLVLVGFIWIIGLVIDNVTEPAFLKLAPSTGKPAPVAVPATMNRHLALEILATLLFYVVMFLGIML